MNVNHSIIFWTVLALLVLATNAPASTLPAGFREVAVISGRSQPTAVRFAHVSYQEAISKGLAVMDTAAFALARDNGLPIIVFNVHEPGALARIVAGEAVGTLVSAG